MCQVRASPTRVFGECPAGHQIGDEILIEGMVVRALKGPLCYVALSAFTCQVTQIKRGRATNHLSCPGCWSDSGQENRVVFVLSSEEAWSLSKKYSAYNWARLDGRATEQSEYHCSRCWTLTKAGDYVQAEREIEQAIKQLKPVD
ncbi:MAG: hypothetical protein JXA89_18590 [Anaerolineae bacterium]|nr:hypothetical protein [Anaerolineae bacterium]